jgi:hypothetical protein
VQPGSFCLGIKFAAQGAPAPGVTIEEADVSEEYSWQDERPEVTN